MLFGEIGYIVVIVGFVFLLLLLLTTHHHSRPKSLLITAALVSIVWALCCTLYLSNTPNPVLFLPVETLRNTAWITLLLSTIYSSEEPQSARHNPLVVGIAIALSVCFLIDIASYWIPHANSQYFLLIHLIESSLGLWLIEQLYRRTHKLERWTIKPICLGLGLIFAYDFAFYANGVLTNAIDLTFFSGRGWITLIALPLVIITARRIKNWSARIYVSRDVVYSSALLTVAGGYLLIMAITGYYIRYLGEGWGSMIQNIFFALSLLILVSLFMSEKLRRQLKVFITKHFYANKYEYREEWMKFAAVLEEQVDSPYEIALNALLRPFDCDRGLLAVFEDGKFKKKAIYNLQNDEIDDETQLAALSFAAIEHHWIIDINELQNNRISPPFEYDHDAIKRLHTFSHIIPVANSHSLKGVCLISSPQSTSSLNWEDRDLMWAISKQLAVYLSLHQSNKLLTENQQFDTFNRMSAFLAHDLKNILAQLQLLAKNGQRHRNNPEFIDDAFETIDSAVTRLTKVVEHLKKNNMSENNNETFSLEKAIRLSCRTRGAQPPYPTFQALTNEDYLLTSDKERFQNMISHLIQNAQDATAADGKVDITTSIENNYYTICIEDNGIGMSDDFIDNRLFKPFDTTKGNSGMGIGAYDAKKFIEQLGGYINVSSTQGVGSCFTLRIPLSKLQPINHAPIAEISADQRILN